MAPCFTIRRAVLLPLLAGPATDTLDAPWAVAAATGVVRSHPVPMPVSSGAVPRVTGVDGCGAVFGCDADTLITLRGANFIAVNASANVVAFNATPAAAGPAPNCTVVSASCDAIVCLLGVPADTSGLWNVGGPLPPLR